jgi:hypothetical protein
VSCSIVLPVFFLASASSVPPEMLPTPFASDMAVHHCWTYGEANGRAPGAFRSKRGSNWAILRSLRLRLDHELDPRVLLVVGERDRHLPYLAVVLVGDAVERVAAQLVEIVPIGLGSTHGFA